MNSGGLWCLLVEIWSHYQVRCKSGKSQVQVRCKSGANHKKHIKNHTNNLWLHHNTFKDLSTYPEVKHTGWVVVFGSTGRVADPFVAESPLWILSISEKYNVDGFKNGWFSLDRNFFDQLTMSKTIKTGHFKLILTLKNIIYNKIYIFWVHVKLLCHFFMCDYTSQIKIIL